MMFHSFDTKKKELMYIVHYHLINTEYVMHLNTCVYIGPLKGVAYGDITNS